jgi:hypothetical protein
MLRGRLSFAFSMRRIIDTARVTTRPASTLRLSRRQLGCDRKSFDGYEVTLVKDATADYSDEEMHAALDINIPNHANAIVTTQTKSPTRSLLSNALGADAVCSPDSAASTLARLRWPRNLSGMRDADLRSEEL